MRISPLRIQLPHLQGGCDALGVLGASSATYWRLAVMLVLATSLAGCAAHYSADVVASPYGFFSGIWHGIVFPYSLITNLVSWFLGLLGIELLRDIQIVGRPNTGFFFYYIGFMAGLSVYGGAGQAAKAR